MNANWQTIEQFLPLVLIFIVFYYLLIRPQQKKVKEHKAMIDALRRGDTVVTGGGLIGKVAKVMDDNTVEIDIAKDVRVRVVRGTLTEVRSKGETAKDGDASSEPKPANKNESSSRPPERKGGLLSKLFK
jgi:preprotein translocase subunit YajC